MVNEEHFSEGPAKPDLIGKVFAERYEVEGLLGEGGMGWVFKARHVLMGHHVALKVMRKGLANDLNAVKRFYHEAKACSRLTQPHTIKVHDFGASSDGFLYIAMELLVGHTLKDDVDNNGAMPVVRVVHISRQICKSLAEAHTKSMIHRDLKPENVYLCDVPGERDYVKLLDFGIAKFVAGGPRNEDLTKAGVVVGTPKYMSPEQAKGAPLTHSSDLYSLGVILYEMITGQVPFDSDSTVTLLIRHASEPAPPIPPVVGSQRIPERLRKLVADLLEKSASRRPPTATAVEEHLMEVLDNIGVPEHRIGALATAAAEMAAKRSAGMGPVLSQAKISAPAAAPLVTGPVSRPLSGIPKNAAETIMLPSEAGQLPMLPVSEAFAHAPEPQPEPYLTEGGIAADLAQPSPSGALMPEDFNALAQAGTRLVANAEAVAAVNENRGVVEELTSVSEFQPSADQEDSEQVLDFEDDTTAKRHSLAPAEVSELAELALESAIEQEDDEYEPTVIDFGSQNSSSGGNEGVESSVRPMRHTSPRSDGPPPSYETMREGSLSAQAAEQAAGNAFDDEGPPTLLSSSPEQDPAGPDSQPTLLPGMLGMRPVALPATVIGELRLPVPESTRTLQQPSAVAQARIAVETGPPPADTATAAPSGALLPVAADSHRRLVILAMILAIVLLIMIIVLIMTLRTRSESPAAPGAATSEPHHPDDSPFSSFSDRSAD